MSDSTRRIRLDLAYDGTDFAGWQLQPGQRTVQGTVEAVLSRIDGDRPVGLRGAGRTDAGVHARQQVADGLLRTSRSDSDLSYALHRMLPVDVRPVQVRTVEPDFHSRRDAREKTYRYRLDRTRYGDPLLQRHALHVAHRFDLQALNAALERLPGRRDWSAFAGSDGRVRDPVRHLRAATYQEEPEGQAWFCFRGDGFLNHMVRNLVGTLLEVARGRFEPERISEILDARDRTLAGPTAVSRGLVLWEVRYDEGAGS